MANRKKTNLSKVAQENIDAVKGWKDRLVEARKEQKLSQRKLAVMAGMGATSLRFVEKEAETVTLTTLLGLANALNLPITYLVAGKQVVLDTSPGDDMPRNIRIIPICSPTDEPGKPEKDLGYVALAAKDLPKEVYALRMDSKALTPDARANEPIEPEAVVLLHDVCVWSPEVEPQPGELCVCDVAREGQKPRLEARVLQLDVDGSYLFGAHNHSFGTQAGDPSRVRGSIVLVQRGRQG